MKDEMERPGRLSGKRALVTGGAGGIGRAVVELFLSEGASVCCIDLDESALAALAVPPGQGGAKLVKVAGDVTRIGSAQQAVEQGIAGLGGLDILVNNVGLSARGTVETTSEADWDRANLSAKSVFLVSRFAVPRLRASGNGAIVNLGSGSAIRPSSNCIAYGAAKAAIVTMTKIMALDHAQDGIRVNSVCPGLTDTELSRRNRQTRADSLGVTLEEVTQQMTRNYPLGRLGAPRDIAHGVLYLVSDEASWVTGTNLIVDGGRCAA